jgi:group I intron endonuclease
MSKIIGIYKITNPKGAIYIGQSVNCLKRKNAYKSLKCENQQKIYNSLIKYGWVNHVFEIIEECCPELLNEKEKEYILLYNSTNPKNGLNICHGGIGSFGRVNKNKGKTNVLSQETKDKISKKLLGNVPWNKGINSSNETRNKIVESHKIRTDVYKKEISDKIKSSVKKLWENEEYRKKQTKQRTQKRGKYRKGIKRDKLKIKIDLGAFKEDYLNYMTINEICNKHNLSSPTIYRIIKENNIKKRGYKCNKNN